MLFPVCIYNISSKPISFFTEVSSLTFHTQRAWHFLQKLTSLLLIYKLANQLITWGGKESWLQEGAHTRIPFDYGGRVPVQVHLLMPTMAVCPKETDGPWRCKPDTFLWLELEISTTSGCSLLYYPWEKHF